jgi:hypothetical protein
MRDGELNCYSNYYPEVTDTFIMPNQFLTLIKEITTSLTRLLQGMMKEETVCTIYLDIYLPLPESRRLEWRVFLMENLEYCPKEPLVASSNHDLFSTTSNNLEFFDPQQYSCILAPFSSGSSLRSPPAFIAL